MSGSVARYWRIFIGISPNGKVLVDQSTADYEGKLVALHHRMNHDLRLLGIIWYTFCCSTPR